MVIPKLRFPEFRGEWEVKKFKDFVKINQGLQIAIAQRFKEKGPNRFFYITNEFLKENSKKEYYIENPPKSVFCNKDDILMTRTGNTGQVVTDVSGAFHNNFFKIKYDKKIVYKMFLYYFLNLNKTQNHILKLAGTSTIPDLNHGDFYNLEINLPSLLEQMKIASFLSKLDEKIGFIEKRHDILKIYKNGIIQQIFNQKLRFKDGNGEDYPSWEEKKLSEILFEHKVKSTHREEVFSVSVHKSLINQVEHLGRTFAASDTSKYNLVKPGDIVYTKSPTGDFPLGIIKQSKLNKNVIVSPLYGVFSPLNKDLGSILDAYFESPVNTRNYLHPIVQKGAKNTMNISNNTFLSRSIILPIQEEEQSKIAGFLSTIDNKIDITNKELEIIKEFKKGLLQQMFVN